MAFNPIEQFTVFELYFEQPEGQRRSYAEISRLFVGIYPNRTCNPQAISALLTRLRVYGACSPRHQHQPGRGSRVSQTAMDLVEATYGARSKMSLSEASRLLPISESTIRRALRQLGYYPYRMRITQKLDPGDLQRRMDFARRMLELHRNNPDYVNSIVFSDESLFKTNGALNKQNTR